MKKYFILKKIFLLALILSGCEVITQERGYNMTTADQQFLKNGIGKLSKTDIEAQLGSPSCVLYYDKDTWYYIFESIEKEAFFHPELKKTCAYILSFKKGSDILNQVEEAKGPISIEISSKTTPLPSTHGNTLIKKVLTNMGRFPQKKKNPGRL